MATLPAGGSAFGSISSAPGQIDQHQLNNTIKSSATTVALNATVSAATTAIRTVRKADRVPSSNLANKTGRVRRVDVVQGQILTLSTLVGGSSYTAGTYNGVALTGGTGTGATANIVVGGGGAVTTVTIVDAGSGYDVGEVLSAAAANIGGTGSGFTITVATTSGPVNA